ncbi:MAG: anthranilate phosphoribosyltransferase [Methanobacteriaceae archaeon]|nr:anthranilate phosphoribosyltransferase [Methanobacteriaceae archaeon]
MIQDVLDKVINGENLTQDEAYNCMNEMMEGKSNEVLISSFLTALRIKNETIDEITGFANSMRKYSIKVDYTPKTYLLDTCGTGGDTLKTFNISTIASIIAATGGVKIAKHGNRSITSKCGGADALERLGVNINNNSKEVEKSIEKSGFGFIYAPQYHPALKNIMPIRKMLNTRTVFNILGPLTCPAPCNAQVMGIFDPDYVEPIANVLSNLGTKRAMVFHGFDNNDNPAMDEISIIGKTKVSFLNEGIVDTKYIRPKDFGYDIVDKKDIMAYDNINDNIQVIKDIVSNNIKTKADLSKKQLCVMNASAIFYTSEIVDSLKEGVNLSEKLLETGQVYQKLEEIKECS